MEDLRFTNNLAARAETDKADSTCRRCLKHASTDLMYRFEPAQYVALSRGGHRTGRGQPCDSFVHRRPYLLVIHHLLCLCPLRSR